MGMVLRTANELATGTVQLVVDAEHYRRIVCDGIWGAAPASTS